MIYSYQWQLELVKPEIRFDDETDATCLAHEVGHALGLQHPTTLGQVIDSCAPENAEAGFGSGIGETGFDYMVTYWPCVGSTDSSASRFCPNGEASKVPYDIKVASGGSSGFMGAGGDWISPYLWNSLLNKPLSPEWSNCSPAKSAVFLSSAAPPSQQAR